QHDGAITTHGKTAYSATFTATFGAVVAVYVIDHILHDVIFPVIALPVGALGPVDIPGVATIRHYQNQVAKLARIKGCAQIASPYGVVLHKTMQQIQYRVTLVRSFIVSRQYNVELHLTAHCRTEEADGL